MALLNRRRGGTGGRPSLWRRGSGYGLLALALALPALLLGLLARPAAANGGGTITIAKETNPDGGTDFPFTILGLAKWGSQGGAAGQFGDPRGVATDGTVVYVADYGNNRIQKFDSGGNFLLAWGRDAVAGNAETGFEVCTPTDTCQAGPTGGGKGEFYGPYGVAMDGAGNVYVVDTNNFRIQKFDSGGNFLLAWGWDVVAGNAETGFEVCTPADTCKTGAYGNGDGQIYGLGVEVDGADVYVADTFNQRIQKFSTGGAYVGQWGGGGSGDGQFNYPADVAIDGAGNVFVADLFLHRVQKFDSAGAYLAQWGSLGSGDGQFDSPTAIATDGAGNVYVLEGGNNRVQKFDGAGAYQAQWGSYGSGDGQFNAPYGLAVDAAGGLYVSEVYNYRVQRIGADGAAVLDDGQSQAFPGLAPMTYQISEQVPSGWVLDDVDCGPAAATRNGNTVSVTLGAGDAVTCTFTNGRPPAVTINQAGGQADPTGSSPIRFRVVFSKPVTGFETGDVTLSGAAGATTAAVTEIAPNDGTTYRVDVSGMTAGGAVTATIAAGVAQDAGGFGNEASTSTDNEVTFNFVAPRLTIAKETNPDGATGFPFTLLGVKTWGSYGSGDGQFYYPYGVAVDGVGNVYVVDQQNQRIQKFDSSGVYLDQWGGYGSGDGQFLYPVGVAADGAGNVYVADYYNHRIQKFDGDGNYLGQWGGSGSGDGQFQYPTGVAADGAGNIYVADTSNNRIQKFDGNGNYLGQWGGSGSGDGQFNAPAGVAVDGSGNVYVADANNNRIQKFDGNGNYLGQWGSSGSGDGQFSNVYGVAVDGAVVYVVDYGNSRIQKFDGDGNYLGQWGGPGGAPGQFSAPYGVAANGAGVFVTELGNERVQKFSPTEMTLDDDESRTFSGLAAGAYFILETVPGGWWLDGIDCDGGSPVVGGATVSLALGGGDDVTCTFTNSEPAALTITKATNPAGGTGFPFSIEPGVYRYAAHCGGYGSGDGQFISPLSVAVDGAGNTYGVDTYNNRIQKFDSDGNYLAQWGGPGSGDSQFNYPYGVTADGAGNVYVADTSNHRIQKFDSAGAYLGQWGEYGSGDSQFQYPFGVAADGAGNVYVVDYGNSRVQKFDGDGNYLAQWGSYGSGDGQFQGPTGVAADGAGNVYVVDQQNQRIQKFDSSGVYLAQWGSYGSGDGQFNYPFGVAADGAGNVYVADQNNHRIQKFDGDGNYLAQWGGNGSGDGQFSSPTGVAADDAGNLYVADYGNSRIQKFYPPGATLDDGQSHTFSDLAAGVYAITEDVPGGWYLVDIDCGGAPATRDGDTVSVTVAAGDDVECVFTNSDTLPPTTGTIVIVKEATPADNTPFSFTENIENTGFTLTDPADNTATFSGVPAGSYTVTEDGEAGWTLDDLVCDDANSVESVATATATINLEAGETVTCTFSNSAVLAPGGPVFVSAVAAGTTGDGVAFGPHDILRWTASDGWSKWFNGTAAGLVPGGVAKHHVYAFWIPDPAQEDVVISFTQNGRRVPGISSRVDGMDLVWWDGSAFSLWFDGQDVGLTVLTQEKIDALHVLDGSMAPPALAAASGGSCLNYLLVSTQGPGRVWNYDGTVLKFAGEDVLGFCLTQTGETTTGNWTMVLDGSAEGMPRGSTEGLSASADGQTLYITTRGTFNVDAATGGHSMVYAYDLGTGQFSGPVFSAPAEGLPRKVTGMQY